MHLRAFIGVLTITLAFAPATSAQDEGGGRLTGEVDGEEIEWVIRSERPHSTTTIATLVPGIHRFSIAGYIDSTHALKDSVSLEFTMRDGEVIEIQIRHFPFSQRHPRFSFGPGHGRGDLVIDTVDTQAERPQVAGRFSGELFYHQSPNTQPISQRTQSLELEFDVSATRE